MSHETNFPVIECKECLQHGKLRGQMEIVIPVQLSFHVVFGTIVPHLFAVYQCPMCKAVAWHSKTVDYQLSLPVSGHLIVHQPAFGPPLAEPK